MAYKLQITGPDGINFNVKYEKLDKAERPFVEAKAPNGNVCKERSVYQGNVLQQGDTQRKWCDDQGNIYDKQSLKFYYEGEEVEENSMTKVFNIEGFQPEASYTDNYVISKYYEVFPSTNDMKKDFDREKARVVNLQGMKKLADYLGQNKVVARGEFCASSKGFIQGDAYIRAIRFGNKWTLEIGVFKEEKVFEHLQEEVPEIPVAPAGGVKKKIRRI